MCKIYVQVLSLVLFFSFFNPTPFVFFKDIFLVTHNPKKELYGIIMNNRNMCYNGDEIKQFWEKLSLQKVSGNSQ